MSSAEDGYCSSDSPRAESPDEPQAGADAESPRAGAGLNKRERDLPASPSSPLPPAKRRYGRGPCVASRLACPHVEHHRVFCAVRARDLLAVCCCGAGTGVWKPELRRWLTRLLSISVRAAGDRWRSGLCRCRWPSAGTGPEGPAGRGRRRRTRGRGASMGRSPSRAPPTHGTYVLLLCSCCFC
jgi:hypothetical protein